MGMQLDDPQAHPDTPVTAETPPPERRFPERYYPAAVLVFLAAFSVYLYTLAPGLMPGDTGDMVKAAATLREAHPPGYPLYSMVGKLFCALPVGDIPYRANLMAAFLGGLAVAFLFLALVIATRHAGAALAGAFLFAFNYLFWTYFALAETFCLNNCCLALVTFLALLWRERRRQDPGGQVERRMLSLLALMAGLSMGNHHTMVLTFAGLAAFVALTEQHAPRPRWRTAALFVWVGLGALLLWGAIGGGIPKPVLLGLALLIIALFAAIVDRRAFPPGRMLSLCVWFGVGLVVPYLYLIAAGVTHQSHHWEDTSTLRGVARLFFRVKYGSLQLAPGSGSGGTPPEQARHYFTALTSQYLGVGFLLGLVGLLVAARRDRSFLLYSGGGFLFGVVFVMKANIDPTPTAYDAATLERFYQLPNFFFVLWAGLGLAAVSRYVEGVLDQARRATAEYRALLWQPALILALLAGVALAAAYVTQTNTGLCATFAAGAVIALVVAGALLAARRGAEGSAGVGTTARRAAITCAALLVLPASLAAANFDRASLRGNYLYPRFMDNLYNSLPKGAILLGWSDTIGMGVDYYSHVERRRPDVAVVLMGLSGSEPYRSTLRREYPSLHWPAAPLRVGLGLKEFISKNLKKHRIFIDGLPSRVPFPVVRHGLVYEIRPEGSKPTFEEVLGANEKIWAKYDLRQVDTSLYPENSMCYSVVVFYYLYQRFCLGTEYNNCGRWADALRHYEVCLKMDPCGYVANSTPYRRQMSRAYIGLKRIPEAITQLELVRKEAPEEPETYALLSWAHRKNGDKAQADRFDKEYERRLKTWEAKQKKTPDPLAGAGSVPIGTATAAATTLGGKKK